VSSASSGDSTPPPRLVARTRRLDGDVDLLAVAGHDGLLFERGRSGLAGRGEALRIQWPGGDPAAAARTVAATLAGIETDDEVGLPGCGPVAFGALPFLPGAPSELVVPQVLAGRAADGTRWVTVVEPTEAPGDGAARRAGDPALPGQDGQPATAGGDAEPTGGGHGDTPDPSATAGDWSARGDVGDALLARLVATGRAEVGAGFPPPRRYAVESTMDPAEWCALVERATKVLADRPAAGTPDAPGAPALAKVVLAREIRVTADRPLDRVAVLSRLRAAYPDCHLVSVDGLVGASPELLVSRAGDVVRSHPMAGTAPRGGDPTTDQRLAASLLASVKDRAEHQITIDMVHDTLLGWCSYLDYEAEPSVVAVANVQHLATLVQGRLSRPAPSVLELVAALHPTPAVAGWPRDEAVAWITAHEGFDRGRYAGTVGWVDGRGNGTWAVALRCAEVDGPMARVFAGNGVVVDSDPQAELAETQAKLQALLSAIVRP
jgi:menaquinone-specific isochorismate synthase